MPPPQIDCFFTLCLWMDGEGLLIDFKILKCQTASERQATWSLDTDAMISPPIINDAPQNTLCIMKKK